MHRRYECTSGACALPRPVRNVLLRNDKGKMKKRKEKENFLDGIRIFYPERNEETELGLRR